jgi:hypothetical protein
MLALTTKMGHSEAFHACWKRPKYFPSDRHTIQDGREMGGAEKLKLRGQSCM